MSAINSEIRRGIELLWLCQELQSEKDGIERPSHHRMDKAKVLDDFARDISRSVTNMGNLPRLFALEDRLSAIGRQLEMHGLVQVDYGDDYADKAIGYLESKQSLIGNAQELTLLNDPSTSNWLKQQLQESKNRDPLDALNDAEILVSVLTANLEKYLNPGKKGEM
ncbi:hypothetical protein [Vibrio sp. SCSIO 43140]|uniref:hypothetical protein n=1 Tax=Vibrio sp. SCSIO 43140 TaxID=2819100 RepID=UPI002075CFC8|nr:hypothetical protein [Vibrio sp. SCSIO 43140]